MNRKRQHWKELLQIITAFANGDDVQYRSRIISESKWTNDPDPSFQCEDLEYRIATKPRKAWLIDYSDGDCRIALTEWERDEHFMQAGRITVREIELPPLP